MWKTLQINTRVFLGDKKLIYLQSGWLFLKRISEIIADDGKFVYVFIEKNWYGMTLSKS